MVDLSIAKCDSLPGRVHWNCLHFLGRYVFRLGGSGPGATGTMFGAGVLPSADVGRGFWGEKSQPPQAESCDFGCNPVRSATQSETYMQKSVGNHGFTMFYWSFHGISCVFSRNMFYAFGCLVTETESERFTWRRLGPISPCALPRFTWRSAPRNPTSTVVTMVATPIPRCMPCLCAHSSVAGWQIWQDG